MDGWERDGGWSEAMRCVAMSWSKVAVRVLAFSGCDWRLRLGIRVFRIGFGLG